MHYRNGREAKNGDKVIQLQMDGAKIISVGVLHDATPGNDYCNGAIASIVPAVTSACVRKVPESLTKIKKGTMNKLLITLLLALAFAGLGCTTIKDSAGNSVRVIDTNKVDKAATLIRAAVADATAVGEALKPDVVNYLRLTVAVLDTAIASTNTSPATLRKSIAAIPVKELSSPWATIAIANGIGAYDIFFQDQLAGVIGGNYAAITLLTAFRNGINDALPQQQNQLIDHNELIRIARRFGLQHGGVIQIGALDGDSLIGLK